MDPLGLVIVGTIYVMLQLIARVRLDGVLLGAAILTVPVLCALLIISVSLGLFGIVGAEIGAIVAVPFGIVYLLAILSLDFFARLFRPSTN